MLPLSAQICTFTKAICSMMPCPRGKVERKAMIRINTVTFHHPTKTPNRKKGFTENNVTKLTNNMKAKWAVSPPPPPQKEKAKRKSKIKLTPGHTMRRHTMKIINKKLKHRLGEESCNCSFCSGLYLGSHSSSGSSLIF